MQKFFERLRRTAERDSGTDITQLSGHRWMNRCAPCAQAMLWTYGAGHSTKGVAWCRELCERAVCVAERVNEAPVTAPASPPGRKFHREVLNQCARGGEGADFLTRHSTANVLRTQRPNTSQRHNAQAPTSANPRCRDASQASGWAHLSTCGQQAEPPAVERWPSTGCRQLVFAVAAPAGIPARLDVSECLPAP